MKSANARFAITRWDEKPYSEGQDTKTFTGDVVPGSATGELRGLQDTGSSAVGHGTEHPFPLDYDLV